MNLDGGRVGQGVACERELCDGKGLEGEGGWASLASDSGGRTMTGLRVTQAGTHEEHGCYSFFGELL